MFTPQVLFLHSLFLRSAAVHGRSPLSLLAVCCCTWQESSFCASWCAVEQSATSQSCTVWLFPRLCRAVVQSFSLLLYFPPPEVRPARCPSALLAFDRAPTSRLSALHVCSHTARKSPFRTSCMSTYPPPVVFPYFLYVDVHPASRFSVLPVCRRTTPRQSFFRTSCVLMCVPAVPLSARPGSGAPGNDACTAGPPAC